MIHLILTLACVDNVETEVATAPSNATAVESRGPTERRSTPTLPIEETSQAGPVGTDAIRSLLMARHDEDLPGVETFEAHENAQESLRWLAENDKQLVVQSRALESLGLWDSDENTAYLLAVVEDGTALEKKRAAAIIGLGHVDLSAREDARTKLLALVTGTEERLALESVGVLATVPEARDGLDALAADAELSPAVQARLAELTE
ncbi:MAG: hypothetical protein GY913_24225 [Proteobacteria bacterium]|nr:hypothetical protein [Pseudomonadota bacterium]MCP4920022.1 hypothetical protein [Pseudomonadota bacterium]